MFAGPKLTRHAKERILDGTAGSFLRTQGKASGKTKASLLRRIFETGENQLDGVTAVMIGELRIRISPLAEAIEIGIELVDPMDPRPVQKRDAIAVIAQTRMPLSGGTVNLEGDSFSITCPVQLRGHIDLTFD